MDDTTRLERDIVTDSPAASHKVFSLCRAMRRVGVRVVVVSMGRGRQNGSGRYFQCKVRRVNGVPVIYLPFFHTPVLSELLSLLSIIPVLWRLRSSLGPKAALFYNRMPVYLLGLVMARIIRFRTVLDLEDGEINSSNRSLSGIKSRVLAWLFDSGCSNGALLACNAIENATRLRPTVCCYGTCEINTTTSRQSMFPVSILFGGTISSDTGAQLLIDAIKTLRKESPEWTENIIFEISGSGDCINQFELLAKEAKNPNVIVHGRITDVSYQQLLARTQVGLALKPNAGALAHTTFPSKVIELASRGILVLTTDISDVRKILANGAIYLTRDDPRVLIDKLQWLVENRDLAKVMALKGKQAVESACSPEVVGQMLKQFIFNTDDVVENESS